MPGGVVEKPLRRRSSRSSDARWIGCKPPRCRNSGMAEGSEDARMTEPIQGEICKKASAASADLEDSS